MAEVKVLGTTQSPMVRRVVWALKMKRVEYEFIQEDLFHKSPLLLQSNPVYKKVPVLLHAGKPISESLVILEYIDETWKQNPMLPADPHERAAARFWAKFGDEKCLPAVFKAFSSEGEEQEKAMDPALESLRTLDRELEGKKFFGGEKMGFADMAIGWIPLLIGVFEEIADITLVDPQLVPSLHAWMTHFTDVPIIKENLPSREELLVYMGKSREFMLALAKNHK